MKMIRLYVKTANTQNFVASLEIPPFKKYPDVVIWGTRAFKHSKHNNYIEVFAYWSPFLKEPK